MKNVLLACLVLFGTYNVVAQDKYTLVRAIGYYQQLKFKESIEVFDVLVEREPENASLIGRRGYVRCQYIMAIDDKLVQSISAEEYADVVEKGIEDLKVGLAAKPDNEDNARCLTYLEKRK